MIRRLAVVAVDIFAWVIEAAVEAASDLWGDESDDEMFEEDSA